MEPTKTPSFRLDGRRVFVAGAGRGIGLTAAMMAPAARREAVVCDSTPGSTTVLMVRGAPQRKFYDRAGAGSAWPSRTREDSARKRLTLGSARIEVEYI